jgi:hypothetical protein
MVRMKRRQMRAAKQGDSRHAGFRRAFQAAIAAQRTRLPPIDNCA